MRPIASLMKSFLVAFGAVDGPQIDDDDDDFRLKTAAHCNRETMQLTQQMPRIMQRLLKRGAYRGTGWLAGMALAGTNLLRVCKLACMLHTGMLYPYSSTTNAQ